MQLSPGTNINDLLSTHPFLEDFLVAYNPHFTMLKNKIARATVGRVATLGAAARIAGVDITALLRDTAAAIEKETAARPEVTESDGDESRAEPAGIAGSGASREGLGTLSGFPSQSTSPRPLHGCVTACLTFRVKNSNMVNKAG